LGVHHFLAQEGCPLSQTAAGTAPATVAWWRLGEGGELTAWLLVRAGSPPLTNEAWVSQVAVGARQPGGWAAVSASALSSLPEHIAAALIDPIGPSRDDLASVAFAQGGEAIHGSARADLYDACLAGALELVARRMGEEIVAEDPRSGLALLRLRTEGEDVVLDLAPALDTDGWRGRMVDVGLEEVTLEWPGGRTVPTSPADGTLEPAFGTATVELAGQRATLPCAHLRYSAAGGGDRPLQAASVPVTLPKLWLPGAPDPVLRLRLVAEAPA
jgi:hypothetical protein